jgi:hypothetical protein
MREREREVGGYVFENAESMSEHNAKMQNANANANANYHTPL